MKKHSDKSINLNKLVGQEDKMLERMDSFKPFNVKANVLSPQIFSYYDKGAKEDVKSKLIDRFKRTAAEGSVTVPSFPNVGRTPLMYVDIMLDPLLLFFPKERLDEVNKRFRRIYETHYLTGNILDLHSTFPLSDFFLQCEDPSVEKYFNDFKDRKDIINLCRQILLEFHTLGEADTYGSWDYNKFEWSDFTQFPPENIDVYGTYASSERMCYLKPDPNLRERISKANIPDKELTKLWDPKFIADVKANRPHLLDNRRLMRFVRNPNRYTLRGISLIWRILHEVLYELKLKMLQLTKADRGMFPLKIFKLGSPERGWIPSKRHFDEFRRQLTAAANDPDFSIIYHFGVQAEFLGMDDKWANLTAEMEFIERRIMLGLFANEAVLAGSDTTYASGAVSVRVLMQKYLTIRTLLEKALIYKIFVPLAKARGFVRRTKAELSHGIRVNSNVWNNNGKDIFKNVQGTKNGDNYRIANSVVSGGDGNIREKYYLPSFIWQKLNLLDNTTLQRFVLDLRDREEIPFDTVADIFGWDKEFINDTLKKETFTVRNPKVREKLIEKAAEDKDIMLKILKGEDTDKIASLVAKKIEKEISDESEKKKEEEKEKLEKEVKEEDKEEVPVTLPPEEKELPEDKEKLPIGETEIVEEVEPEVTE